MLDITALLAKNGVRLPNHISQLSALDEVQDFGPNPGNLRMLRYVPKELSSKPALLVVLHGCTQTAADYDRGAGWSTLADRYGFVLLFPEQQRANNPNGCFNWFRPSDVRRGQGEVASIRQMIERCVRDYGVDLNRIFITGLSAGGAMASAMLACYPEVFAGGAIIAGLPFGAVTDVRLAFEAMSQGSPRSAKEWGALVRQASPHAGPWPRISVWHGGADTTVVPANAREIVKQWLDVHGVADVPMREDRIVGVLRHSWKNSAGQEVIESFTIPRMTHGTPLAVGKGEDQGGVAGPFMLEAGIFSSHYIAKFFELTDDVTVRATSQPRESVSSITLLNCPPESVSIAASRRLGIQATIENALKAAGLR